MEAVLFIIAASALWADASVPERRYRFVEELKNWTEARSYCRAKHTDLATVDSLEMVKILNDLASSVQTANSGTSQAAWIGLYTNNWSWSMSDRDFYPHDEFRNWGAREPNGPWNTIQCGQLLNTGFWNDAPCNWLHRPVCSDVNGQEATFVYVSAKMSWTQAQNYCREHHTDLASVRNTSENQQIVAANPTAEPVWIGLVKNPWKWSNGEKVTFSYWGSGEPRPREENCVVANFGSSGRWQDRTCDAKAPFVCYEDLVPHSKHVVRVRLVRSSSVDLNDPDVQEDLLQQLKQKLKDQGVNGDIKLSWRRQADGEIFHKEEEEEEEEERG